MQSSRPDVFAQENGTRKTVETDHQLPEPKYEKILNFIYRSKGTQAVKKLQCK